MELITDTLSIEKERWEDPGDYPSAAGSGPLPSYYYAAAIDGYIEVHINDHEVNLTDIELITEFARYIKQGMIEIDLDDKIIIKSWEIERSTENPRSVKFRVSEFDADDYIIEDDYDDDWFDSDFNDYRCD